MTIEKTICGVCKIEKFYESELKGKKHQCKSCCKEYNKEQKKSHRGVLTKIYSGQICSSKHRGHELPTYSRQEFIGKFLKDEKFLTAHRVWTKMNYDKKWTPSVDRIDDSKGYSFDNIIMTTWQKNLEKPRIGRPERKVNQYSLSGGFIATFESVSKAANFFDSAQTTITNAASQKKAAIGYLWRYTDSVNGKGKLKSTASKPQIQKLIIQLENTLAELKHSLNYME